MASNTDFLFILTQDLESPSGLGRYLPLASALAQAGYRVKVIALHPDYFSLAEKELTINGIQVHYVAPMHVIKHGNKKTYYGPLHLAWILLKATVRLTQEALKSSARCVVVGKPHPMNGVAGLACKWLYHTTLLVDCDDYEAGSGNFQSPLQRTLVAFIEKNLPRLADLVSTNTHFMQGNLVRWGTTRDKIYYLPNGIDEQRFVIEQPAQEIEALRRNLGLENKQVIAYIGSFSLASHPVLLLLDAFERVIKHVPQAVLLMVGGGEDFDQVVEKVHAWPSISGRVIFVGRVPPAKAPQYYRLAHVSVDPVLDSPGIRGRCPLKMFESWSTGTPFVTSDVGDRKLLAADPPAALLALAGDPSDLADKITSVLGNQELAEELSERGILRAPLFYWTRLSAGFAAFVNLKRNMG